MQRRLSALSLINPNARHTFIGLKLSRLSDYKLFSRRISTLNDPSGLLFKVIESVINSGAKCLVLGYLNPPLLSTQSNLALLTSYRANLITTSAVSIPTTIEKAGLYGTLKSCHLCATPTVSTYVVPIWLYCFTEQFPQHRTSRLNSLSNDMIKQDNLLIQVCAHPLSCAIASRNRCWVDANNLPVKPVLVQHSLHRIHLNLIV